MSTPNRPPRDNLYRAYIPGVEFRDAESTDSRPRLTGHWMWDVSAGLSIPAKSVQYDFRVACQNTLNVTYREYTNRLHYYADDLGRNIVLSFKLIF